MKLTQTGARLHTQTEDITVHCTALLSRPNGIYARFSQSAQTLITVQTDSCDSFSEEELHATLLFTPFQPTKREAKTGPTTG